MSYRTVEDAGPYKEESTFLMRTSLCDAVFLRIFNYFLALPHSRVWLSMLAPLGWSTPWTSASS